MVNFEGFAEGTIISNQYSGLGVTFGQADGGTPMIDNLPPLFGFGPGSGVGMLTGSTNGGAPFPTVAGLTASFTSAMSRVGAFFSDTSPLGSYTFTAFGGSGNVLETFTITATTANTQYAGCGLFPTITGCGLFVGFDRSAGDIFKVQFGPSSAFGDAFAIDDLRFEAAVPEPSSILLLGTGVGGLWLSRRRRAR